MQIQDLRKDVISQLDKIDLELEGQMIVNWTLEGKRAAYEHVRELLNRMFDEWKGETLKDLSEKEIMEQGKKIIECYSSCGSLNGYKCYSEKTAVYIFMDGAKWILGQLKA